MKTAIQELIEELKLQKKAYRSGDFRTCVQLCVSLAEKKLKKEQEQIKEAYKSGKNNKAEGANQYFNCVFSHSNQAER